MPNELRVHQDLCRFYFISGGTVVNCSRFYCYFNLEMITKYLVELYNLFSALMLPAQGSKRECSVNKI